MKKLTFYSMLFLFVLVGCKNDKELKKRSETMSLGALTLSTDKPQPGQTIDIIYTKNSDDLEAFYAYMVGQSSYPVDIDFTNSEGEQKSSINIPDSASALAFVFKSEDTYDDNEKQGYLVPLYDEDGNKVPGSAASLAYYSNYYGSNYGIKVEDKAIVEAIKADMDANPELKKDWEITYLELAYKLDKEKGQQMINEYLASASKKANKDEDDYSAMMRVYTLTKDKSKYDSIQSLTIEKFPNGKTANFAMVRKFGQESDMAKKEQMLSDYAKAHPEMDNLGNYMANNVAMTYFNQGDMTNFEKYSGMVQDKESRASTLNNMAWGMAEKGEKLDQAEKMSKTSLDIIESLQKNPEEKPDYLTQRQYEKSLESSWSMYADTYALILFKQGKVKDAIAYQEKAHDPKAQDAGANERFIEYLMADKQYAAVVEKAEKFIELGHSNDNIKADYKTAYMKEHPDSKDVDERLMALEETAKKNYIAEVKKSMLNDEAPKFTLKDMDGKDVSLASLKGKTVVLDFWATWCGPCKASFPGMQQVVTKYKDDDKVKLLFVDTFESGDDREKNVQEFIKKNNYTFHVVYDSEDSDVAEQFEVSGIPTKIVVGPDGNIKFKSVGYNGSVDKLMEEMDLMIELSKT